MLATRNRLFQAASVALFALISFVFSLPNQRVWDDEKILGKRLAPQSESSPFQLWVEPYWGREHPDAFRPLGLTILYAERRVFGVAMTGFRCVSLVLHASTGLALLRVLRRVAPDRIAWMAALVFSVHPAHAEAVAMAYGQLELLAAFFALLAIDQYLASEKGTTHLAAALICAFLSACSKESGLMLPAVIVLVRGLYLRPSDSWKSLWITWREAIFSLPAIIYMGLRYGALGTLCPTGIRYYLWISCDSACQGGHRFAWQRNSIVDTSQWANSLLWASPGSFIRQPLGGSSMDRRGRGVVLDVGEGDRAANGALLRSMVSDCAFPGA